MSHSHSYEIGLLLGLLCGGVVGLVPVVALVVWLVRRGGAPIAAASCPRCGSTTATPIAYAWWGGALGPKLLSHVECTSCHARYNGKTGQPNTVGIAIYLVVSTAVGLVVVGGLLWLGFAR
jgi:hypothetical protein